MNVSREEFRAGLAREKQRRTGARPRQPEFEPDQYADYCREQRTKHMREFKRRIYGGG